MKSLHRILYVSLTVCLLPFASLADGGSILNPTPKKSLCFENILDYPGPLPPVLEMPLDYTEMYESEEAAYLDRYATYLNSLLARATVSIDAQQRLMAEMLQIARTKPIQWPDKANPPHNFEFITLMPYIVGYAHHKNAFSPAERLEVEGWINSRFKLIGDRFLAKKANSRVYDLGSLIAAYGYAIDNPALTKKAYRVYTTAIKYLREDGSLREDSERGGSALFYTASSIGNLVTLAEMLRSSGIDAYSYSYKDQSLHDAVAFLVAATKDPSLIYGYASQNPEQRNLAIPGYSPEKMDMTWLKSHLIGWGHFYIARFPNHPNSKALLELSPYLRSGEIQSAVRPAGNSRCFLGR